MSEIVEYVTDVVEKVKNVDFAAIYPDENPVGKCPVCTDKKVYERPWFYGCETNTRDGRGCGFLIWKDNSGRYVDRHTASLLLEKGETGELDGFYNSSGQMYKAKLKIDGNKVERVTSSSADEETLLEGPYEVNPEPLAACPTCEDGAQHKIIESPSLFICETRKQQILDQVKRPRGFVLPRTICQREVTREEAIAYIANQETDFITDFVSKKGRKFKAKLKLRPDGRHEFEFPPRMPKKKKSEDDEPEESGDESQAQSSDDKGENNAASAKTKGKSPKVAQAKKAKQTKDNAQA